MAEDNEKKDSSTVGKINNAVNTVNKGRNFKRAYKTAKTARTLMMAAEGAELFANPAVVVILAIAFVLVVVIIILFGGVSGVKGGDLNNNPTTGGVVTPLPVDQVAKYLVITGATDAQKQKIYRMFSVPMGSSKYLSLLIGADGKRKIYIALHTSSDGVLSGGAQYNTSRPQIDGWNFWNPTSDTVRAHWLIHESGHLIDRYNGWISDNSYSRTSLIKSDPSCYNGWYRANHNPGSGGTGNGYIKTYAYRDGDLDASGKQIGGGANHETFAESIADYVYCKPGASCDLNGWLHSTPIKFNGGCGTTYKWFQVNIFGGDDFFTTSTSTSPKDANPNSNDCGGVYASWFYKLTHESIYASFLYKNAPNFGDPQCTLTTAADRDNLYNLLVQLAGKADANIWFYTVIPCESSYHANSFNPGSKSGDGAYGMYQMNPTKAKRGNYDVGDVYWPLQTSNAVNRNKYLVTLNQKWKYWACARSYW